METKQLRTLNEEFFPTVDINNINVLERIDIGTFTLNQGSNKQVSIDIDIAKRLNNLPYFKFFIIGAIINNSDKYFYAFKDGDTIKCFRHYSSGITATQFFDIRISNINTTEGKIDISYNEDRYVLEQNVISKTNTTEYTPTADYHPATKKYIDDKSGIILTEAEYTALGDSINTDNKLYFITD